MKTTGSATSKWLMVIVAALVLMVVGAGMYIGRLRWQNALLRADLTHAERRFASVPTPPAVTQTGRAIAAEQRSAMLEQLATETGAQKEVWFTWAAGDREAAAYQRTLQGVFEEAGWSVRRSQPATFPLRPGVFVLMADVAPPRYVLTAMGAIQLVDSAATAGTDYRAFHERKKREEANWRGFDMDADQTYIVAVGRQRSE